MTNSFYYNKIYVVKKGIVIIKINKFIDKLDLLKKEYGDLEVTLSDENNLSKSDTKPIEFLTVVKDTDSKEFLIIR